MNKKLEAQTSGLESLDISGRGQIIDAEKEKEQRER